MHPVSSIEPNIATATDWKCQLREAVDDVHGLLKQLELDIDSVDYDTSSRFKLRVPQAYIDSMQVGDPHDPLLLQVLPRQPENEDSGMLDPVSDLDAMLTTGLLQKYHGRALMITTGACAIHCRYCFRRHYPYADAGCNSSHIDDCVATLQQQPETDEIILSGGDPLVLDDARLRSLIERVETVAHLRYLRIHTRLPVVLPDRVTDALLQTLQNSRLRCTLVIHANHGNEISTDVSDALGRLHSAGVTLLNQSVLLRGINDNADILAELSKRLHDNRVLPYYLHLLDPVRGAMHFDVPETEARQLLSKIRARLPGYLVPTLVREIPNSPSKTAISAI